MFWGFFAVLDSLVLSILNRGIGSDLSAAMPPDIIVGIINVKKRDIYRKKILNMPRKLIFAGHIKKNIC